MLCNDVPCFFHNVTQTIHLFFSHRIDITSEKLFRLNDTMSLLEQIQNNRIVDLHVDAAADDVFDSLDKFFAALEENQSIKTIHLEKDFIGDLRHDSREKLLYALGKVKTLKRITLSDGIFQISHVSAMVKNANALRYLCVRRMVLQGIEADFNTCEKIISAHRTMNEFEMQDCIPAVSSISLERLSKAGGGQVADNLALDEGRYVN